MGRAIFLANPDLNVNDVTVAHSSAIGRRAGHPIYASNNARILKATAIGDAGDGTDRLVEIYGSQRFPRYKPYTAAGVPQSTDPAGFAAVGALTVADTSGCALAAIRDQLHFFTLNADVLGAWVWDGSAFALRVSIAIEHDGAGGIAVAVKGTNAYIAVGNNTDNQIHFYRYNAITMSLGEIGEGLIQTESPGGIAFASDGAIFVLLHDVDLGGGLRDVKVMWGGDVTRLKVKPHSFLDMFDTTWTAGGNIRRPALCWTPRYKFVAVLRAGTETPGLLRVARSYDGDDWEEFTDIDGAVAQPDSITAPSSNGRSLAVAPEGRRLFVFRTTGVFNGDPSDVKMTYFSGRRQWIAEVDADGGVDIADQPRIAACNWRGAIYVAFPTSTQWVVRKCNLLTETDTGHQRAMEMGRRNFVAGLDDDTRTALFFTPRGIARKFDTFTIPAKYDHDGRRTILEPLGEGWRAEDGGEEWVRYDAGLGRLFAVDAIALFGTNLPSLTLEMDDDPDFTTPPVSETISATITTAAVVSGAGNVLTFASGTFQHYQHAETTRWVQLSTGVSGIFRILDNSGDSLIVDGDVTGAGGTATIFGDRMWLFLDQVEKRRYLRVVTPELELPDGYYEISRALFGLKFTLPRNFSSGFTRQIAAIESPLELKSGSRIVTSMNPDRRHTWNLPWQVIKYETGQAALEGFYARLNGAAGQLAFWPHPDSPVVHQMGVHLCRIEQPMQEQHINARYHAGGLVLASEV